METKPEEKKDQIPGAEVLSADIGNGVSLYRKDKVIFLMMGKMIIPFDQTKFLAIAEQISNVVDVIIQEEDSSDAKT